MHQLDLDLLSLARMPDDDRWLDGHGQQAGLTADRHRTGGNLKDRIRFSVGTGHFGNADHAATMGGPFRDFVLQDQGNRTGVATGRDLSF